LNFHAIAVGMLLTAPFASPVNQPEAPIGLWRGIDYGGMDRTLDPIADFDLYASAKWYAKNPIPPDQGSWSTGQLIKQRNQEILKGILERASADKNTPPASRTNRLGAFYRSAMNEETIESAGIQPIQATLARITHLASPQQLWNGLPGIYRETAVFAPIPIHTDTDPKDNKKLILVIDEGGIGLPGRQYYLSSDSRMGAIRESYREHVRRTLVLAGDSEIQATEEARRVIAFETRLAQRMRPDGEESTPSNAPLTVQINHLDDAVPGLALQSFVRGLGITQSTQVSIANPAFLREVQTMLRDEPVSSWQSYLRWQFLRSVSPALPRAFAAESFAFEQGVLGGRLQDMPRWKRAVIWTDDLLGDDLGYLYVAENFTPQTKARAQLMIANIVLALRGSIATRTWMTASTKQSALAKLDKLTFDIGYPDKWRDYSGLKIDDSPFVVNYLRAERFTNDWTFSRLGKERDQTEWEHTPPTINAYCDADTDKIVFSAGILQPPFFDPDASDEVNYAQIGSVMGHELTHLFRWTGDDEANFRARALAIEQQYSAYTLPDGSHLNGKLTLSENIADIGGLRLAYLAWKASGKSVPVVVVGDGLTPDQRFFIAYAQSWRIQTRPETARLRLVTDPHAPGHFRIVGPLSYMPEFYEAFRRSNSSAQVVHESLW